MKTITPTGLQSLLSSGQSIALIDVRTPAEFAQVHVLQARNRRNIIALSCYFAAVLVAWVSVPVAILLVIFPMMMYLFADRILPEQK